MTRGAGDVVEQVRTHVGNSLRAIVIYDSDATRDLYRRPDARGVALPGLEAVRGERTTDASSGEDREASVRVFESCVVVDLPRDANSGTVLALDRSAARSLADFVDDIRADIYGD